MTLTLRPYQQEAIRAVEAAYARGVQRPAISLPTGTGKTICFAELLSRRPGRSLLVVHRDELAQQSLEKIRLTMPNAEIGIVKGELNQYAADVVIASVQTLSRPQRLEQVAPNFQTVVIDECHHAVAPSYMRVLEYMGSFQPNGPLTLGVSATIERSDGIGLGEVFEEIVYEKPLLEMVEAGYLSDLRAVQVHLEADFSTLRVRAGDFIDSEVEDLLLDANAPAYAVQAYRQYAPGRKGLIFTPTIRTAEAMSAAFVQAGIPAEALSGKTPEDERRAILRRLKSGETRLVANCAVLVEGFDEPSIDVIVMARPTKSRPFFVQMLGRGTRTYPGKDDCLVIDLVGSATRVDLMTTATLFGLSPEDIEARTVSHVAAVQREEQARQEAHGQMIARAVNLFEKHKFHWVPATGNRFVLSLGGRMLVLNPEPDSETWAVQQVAQGVGSQLARGLDLGYAMGFAEDIARESQAEKLIDPNAPWRQKPASDNQLAALKRCRIRIRPGLTRGEASDLLSKKLAGAGR